MQAVDIHRLQIEHGLSDKPMDAIINDYRVPLTEEQFRNGVDIVVKKAANDELSRDQYEARVRELYLGAKSAGKYGGV